MKATLIALLVGLFGVTTVLHANEPTAATEPTTEAKKEETSKKDHQKSKKAKKGKKAEQHPTDAAAPAATEAAPTPQ